VVARDGRERWVIWQEGSELVDAAVLDGIGAFTGCFLIEEHPFDDLRQGEVLANIVDSSLWLNSDKPVASMAQD